MNKILIKGEINLNNFIRPILLIGFLIYCTSTIDFINLSIGSMIFLLFVIVVVSTLTFSIVNSYKTEIIIDESGIKGKSLISTRSIEWDQINSLDVVLKTKYSEDPLKKEDYFSNIYLVGNKLIVVSEIEREQLYQSSSTKRKKLYYLPFRKDIIAVLQEHGLLEVTVQK